MPNISDTDVPEPVLKLLKAMATQALVKCGQLGISGEDYYHALQDEQRRHPELSISDLFERTFKRFEQTLN